MAEERQKRANEKQAESLLNLLPATPPGLSYRELYDKTGLGDKVLRTAMQVLKGQGKADTTGKPRSRINPLRFHRKEQHG